LDEHPKRKAIVEIRFARIRNLTHVEADSPLITDRNLSCDKLPGSSFASTMRPGGFADQKKHAPYPFAFSPFGFVRGP
jgi:hypothetical protein